MSELSLKTHYSVAELLSFKLSSLPSAHKNVLEKAKRENWIAQKRKSKGGGLEYELISMPEAVQTEIRSRFAVAVVESKPKKLPAVKAEVDLANLTTKQREIADARIGLIQYVLDLEQSMSRIKAVTYVCELAKSGRLPPHLAVLVETANAKKSKKRTVSVRTLNGWVVDYCKVTSVEQRLKLFAPLVRQEVKAEEIWWLSWLLGIYRQKNALSVQESYRYFEAEWVERYADNPMMLEAMPNISKVRRAMAKLPIHILEKGRLSGSKYKQLLPYVMRDWSPFVANDIWIGDGHSLKLKVAHPVHGRPFTPELTMIIDGASRKIVGWSLSLSENAFAVLDALRHGIATHGVPAIYYSDNGGGEKNKILDAEVTGILPRFSIHHATGIAGNPQGRGIIERLNKTVGLRIAERFETYYGKNADPEATRKMLARQLAYANAKNGKELTALQKKARRELPSWEELKAVIQEVIDWYNNEHVHSEIRCTPAVKYQRVTDIEKVVWLSDVELRDIQRPEFIRTTNRGLIEWNNHKYFSLNLLDYQGEEVVIGVDIHDPMWVQVRTKDGRFICNAEFEGNKRDAFPQSFVEQKREERAKGRLKRKEQQVAEIMAERNPVITIEHQQSELITTSYQPKREKVSVRPIFTSVVEREEWEKKQALIEAVG
ncbi:Mu transposase C-terminal domain-containing protein [Glaesserella parasuis]|nr:Mu transposase C-terminal domain-containing protein [Glaesserella parasuis]MCT8779884.1 Mu transposase C-terminal domain-containing protein [Glaesserella parasuis]